MCLGLCSDVHISMLLEHTHSAALSVTHSSIDHIDHSHCSSFRVIHLSRARLEHTHGGCGLWFVLFGNYQVESEI